jgi:indole-3-glycerol phosphate synthase
MANLLEPQEMKNLFELTRQLGMDALFECHTLSEITQVPAGARLYGINSRTFATDAGTYAAARKLREAGSRTDMTTDLSRFEMGDHLPTDALRVAESGVHPETVARLRDELHYHAALVGTSLLTAQDGLQKELRRFEAALALR